MRIKNKIVSVFFMSICLLLVVPFTHAIELTEEFSDQKYGYSIQHPSTWTAGNYRSGIIWSEVNSNDGQSGLQIRFMKSTRNIESFVDQYIEDFKKQMKASLIREHAIIIDQLRGYTVTFKSNRSGKNYFLKSYILPKSNRSGYYVFQAGTPYKIKSQIEPALDKIANSFRVN